MAPPATLRKGWHTDFPAHPGRRQCIRKRRVFLPFDGLIHRGKLFTRLSRQAGRKGQSSMATFRQASVPVSVRVCGRRARSRWPRCWTSRSKTKAGSSTRCCPASAPASRCASGSRACTTLHSRRGASRTSPPLTTGSPKRAGRDSWPSRSRRSCSSRRRASSETSLRIWIGARAWRARLPARPGRPPGIRSTGDGARECPGGRKAREAVRGVRRAQQGTQRRAPAAARRRRALRGILRRNGGRGARAPPDRGARRRGSFVLRDARAPLRGHTAVSRARHLLEQAVARRGVDAITDDHRFRLIRIVPRRAQGIPRRPCLTSRRCSGASRWTPPP